MAYRSPREGADRRHSFFSPAGGLVIAISVANIVNIIEIFNIVRNVWNVIFGLLMILLQLNWRKMITRNFGFLNNWMMRAMFYIFVGTNIMNPEGDTAWLTYGIGGACMFVGIIEIAFGCGCAHVEKEENGDLEEGADGEEGSKKKKGRKGQTDPTGVEPVLTVNLNPNQVAAAGSWAASNAGSLAAAAGSSGGGGGTSDNPFFGNAHR